MMKTDPFVLDLVVPIHGNLPLNELFFESLVRNTHYPFRLIVIDNASPDESPSFFERQKGDRFQVQVVRNSVNRCYPVSMNQGIALATSPVVGLLNNDIVVGPEWDRPLVDFILEGKGDIASPIGLEHLPRKNWEEILFYRWRSILKKSYSDNPGENYRRKINVMYGEFDQFSRWITREFSDARFPGIMGHCHLVSRSLMLKTGGLDVRLQAADWDLYLTAAQLQSQGDIKSLPMILGGSWVHHFIRGSAKNIRKVAFSCDHPPHLYPESKWGVEAIRHYWPFLDQRPGYKKSFWERGRKILNRWRGQLSQSQLPLERLLSKIDSVKDKKAQ
jgi:glycosyltransferase involved in cell wall biosynthesis